MTPRLAKPPPVPPDTLLREEAIGAGIERRGDPCKPNQPAVNNNPAAVPQDTVKVPDHRALHEGIDFYAPADPFYGRVDAVVGGVKGDCGLDALVVRLWRGLF